MAKKKIIDNPANNINLVGDMLVSTGNTVPEKKETVQKSITPQVTANTGWTHFTVICNGDLVEKIKAIAQKEGFTIRDVVEKFFRNGIGSYEGKHGVVKVRSRKKQNIDDVL